ncbi:MAG: hypothetical protein E6J90_38725 [Deltaproteobacteria bacterium]|nr:MAG: hypothetical protein E6J90_38725 [Deltaproteobacteria bacterium]
MHDVHHHEVTRDRAGLRLGIAALVGALVPPVAARADHDTAMSEGHHGEASEVSVGLSVEAAAIDSTFYVGSYQGVTPSLGWMRGRFGAGAAISLYHLSENGRGLYGRGDLMLAGHAAVITTDAVHAGVALHVMAPTGSELDGLGMGHVMVMPSVSASWRAAPLTFAASGGYGRALVGLGGQHDHGPMPLVDPMNLQELTWGASADVDLGHGLQVGGRMLGAVPLGSGLTRVIAGGRVAWGTPRFSTGFEAQVGLAGDPFTIRGVLDTALRF